MPLEIDLDNAEIMRTLLACITNSAGIRIYPQHGHHPPGHPSLSYTGQCTPSDSLDNTSAPWKFPREPPFPGPPLPSQPRHPRTPLDDAGRRPCPCCASRSGPQSFWAGAQQLPHPRIAPHRPHLQGPPCFPLPPGPAPCPQCVSQAASVPQALQLKSPCVLCD